MNEEQGPEMEWEGIEEREKSEAGEGGRDSVECRNGSLAGRHVGQLVMSADRLQCLQCQLTGCSVCSVS